MVYQKKKSTLDETPDTLVQAATVEESKPTP